MVSDGKIEPAFPQETPIRCVVYTKRKFREIPGPDADASGENPRPGVGRWRTIIFDVEFVGLRRKHFAGPRIVGFNGDERGVFVLKAESGCYHGISGWDSKGLACQDREGDGENG